MEKTQTEMSDELRPEYDLRSLRVRRPDPGRKSFGGMIRLKSDVVDEVVPDAMVEQPAFDQE